MVLTLFEPLWLSIYWKFWSFLLDVYLNFYFCPVGLFPLPGGYTSLTCIMDSTPEWARWPTTVAALVIVENCSMSLVISFLYRWWAIEPTLWFSRSPRNMLAVGYSRAGS
ncbi:unnamed protein product, partial [Mesorhabditis spiculigera]